MSTTTKRAAAALALVMALGGFGLGRASAGAGSTSRYDRRAGLGPVRIVLVRCVSEDDFGAGLRLVSYSGARTVLGCRSH